MPSTDLVFASRDEHRDWLATQAVLPAGFRAGTAGCDFVVAETGGAASMRLALIAADEPCADFAAVFTRNAFPGAPVTVGRRRLGEPALRAVLVNNKISNVCAPDGEAVVARCCAAVGEALGCAPEAVLAASTGVIGWSLPVDAMCAAIPDVVADLRADGLLEVADAIRTTDLYPKVRRAAVGGGSVVGVAKGAGMVEPDMATMLAYVLTDCAVPRDRLRTLLADAVATSFNAISIDGDQSTSDSVACLSSGRVDGVDEAEFAAALGTVCADLAEDLVRNGEGVRHVMAITVAGAPDRDVARGLGKAVANSPLWSCAVAGNDANVGRLVCAVGDHVGSHHPDLDLSRCTMAIGGRTIFADGAFRLDPQAEAFCAAHLEAAELYASRTPADGTVFAPPIDYPPHERRVEVTIDLGVGDASATVLGADLTHEYVSENADYRS